MLNFDFYACFTEETPLTVLDGVSTSGVQMIKALLNLELSRMESDRAYLKNSASGARFKNSKDYYWKEYSKVTKKINKLAKLQAKIKRNL